MKALSKLKPEPGIWMVHDAPVPTIGPNDVLIKITKSSICGTDVHIHNWDAWSQRTIPVPMIIGHEYTGVIEKLGSAVTGLKTGQRVCGEGHLVCGHCRNCRAGMCHLCRKTAGIGVHRQGSFAEFLSLPASNVFPIPDDVPDDIAAIFDPLGNAVHTALSFDITGEDVAITGAGPIGIMAAAICRHVGARHIVITDVNPYRLALARKMGVTLAIDVTKETLKDAMDKLGMKEGFDVGLEMSGNESALRGLFKTVRHGGKIALLGIPAEEIKIDMNEVIFKGLTLKGIYGREMFETWYKMTSLIQSGLNLAPLITHRFPIDDFQKGFAAMISGESGKVILDWS